MFPFAAVEVVATEEHHDDGVDMLGSPAYCYICPYYAHDEVAVNHVHEKRAKFEEEGRSGVACS